jgi:hypothetical protein
MKNGIAGAAAGPHPERDSLQTGTALYVTLSEQDANFLRHALRAAPAQRDGLGIKETPGLAFAAVGAVCRAIIEGGYRPRPLYAEIRQQDLLSRGETLPPGVIKIQLV